jgi:hypothetical protein
MSARRNEHWFNDRLVGRDRLRRGDFGWRIHPFNRGDELIALPPNRLDEAWLLGIVAERQTDLADAVVQPLIEFDECRLQSDFSSVPPQRLGAGVELEAVKPPLAGRGVHRGCPTSSVAYILIVNSDDARRQFTSAALSEC